MEIAGLAAAVGGTLMQQQSASDAADKQQSIINQGAEENTQLSKKKENTIQNFAESTFNPTTRDQSYENAATKNESSLADALLSANGGESGEVKQGSEGNLSNDYVRGRATATANATNDILNRARLMARNNAGGLMYGDESLKGGQLASDVMGINSTGTRSANATRSALSGVDNKGSLVGGLLMGAAPMVGGLKTK